MRLNRHLGLGHARCLPVTRELGALLVNRLGSFAKAEPLLRRTVSEREKRREGGKHARTDANRVFISKSTKEAL